MVDSRPDSLHSPAETLAPSPAEGCEPSGEAKQHATRPSSSASSETEGGSDFNEDVQQQGKQERAADPSQPTPVMNDSSPMKPSPSAGRPYSAFSPRMKWAIVLLASLGALFSPISSIIIVPSLTDLSEDFGTSISKINLTLVVYLIFQGIAPSFIASASDSIGRRPVILSTLTLYTVACVSLAVCPDSSFGLFLFLRIVQAIGGSPLIALGAGCVSDVASTAERGKYMGLFSGVSMFGPALGPVLGGLINQFLTWRWVFWILAIWCGCSIAVIAFFYPETLRAQVGDGTLPPAWQSKRPQDLWRQHQRKKAIERGEEVEQEEEVERPPHKKYAPFASFKALFQPDIACLLAFAGFVFASMYAVMSTYSTFLQDDYGFNSIEAGLCYLPMGMGSLLTAIFGGRLLDWDYRRTKKKLGFVQKHPRDIEGFPIERTRLHFLPISYSFMIVAMLGYGWAFETHSSFVIPLVINFFVGMGNQYTMQVVNCLLVDLYPQAGGAITASFNLTRCLLGAVVTGYIDPLQNKVGIGWAMVITCAISLALAPLLLVILWKGPDWRAARLEASKRSEAKQEAKRSKA